jgi:hypothetical protein
MKHTRISFGKQIDYFLSRFQSTNETTGLKPAVVQLLNDFGNDDHLKVISLMPVKLPYSIESQYQSL